MPYAPEEAAFVAADWGTSSLRVWALSAGGVVLAERRSDEGMARLDPAAFEPALRRHLQAMVPAAPDGLPVVLCGMAGARQGWRDAGYVDVPAAPAAICSRALAVAAPGLDVRILPGLADRRPGREDVMRGEETQLLGLLLDAPAQTGLVCLPGTHSKWVQLEAGRVAAFSTAMTGEVFALLSRQSVLQHSLQGAAPSGDPDSPAFLGGVARGLAEPARLLAALFGVRAASLLRDVPGQAAADTLSGLLIGAEIAAAGAAPGARVTLVASGSLAALYRRALQGAGLDVTAVDAVTAVQRGLMAAGRQLWPERLT